MQYLSILMKSPATVPTVSVKKILLMIQAWRIRSRMRHQLAQMPDFRLEDMGIGREDALAESQKPFWVE